MIKVIGMILIVSMTSLVGIFMSTGLSKRVRQIELILILIEKMQTHIRFQKTPTVRMITELSAMEQFNDLPFLKLCSNELVHTKDFPCAWKAGIDKSKDEMHLEPDDLSIVYSLSDILGSSDAEGQISALDLSAQMLEQNLRQAAEKKKSHGKMYRSLGVLAGIGLVVIIV